MISTECDLTVVTWTVHRVVIIHRQPVLFVCHLRPLKRIRTNLSVDQFRRYKGTRLVSVNGDVKLNILIVKNLVESNHELVISLFFEIHTLPGVYLRVSAINVFTCVPNERKSYGCSEDKDANSDNRAQNSTGKWWKRLLPLKVKLNGLRKQVCSQVVFVGPLEKSFVFKSRKSGCLPATAAAPVEEVLFCFTEARTHLLFNVDFRLK